MAPFIAYFIVSSDDSQDDIYISKYGSFYQEFKSNKGKFSSIFYVIFFIRRLQYASCQLLLSDYPIIQVSMIIFFSILQFVYIIYVRPFKEKSVMLSEFLGEVCALVTFISCFVLLIYDNSNIVKYLELIVQWNVIGGIGIQVFICLISFVNVLLIFYRSCKHTKKFGFVDNVIKIKPAGTRADNDG